MQKSILVLAVAMTTTFGIPAQAAKYTCTFSQNGNPVGPQCDIDPTTAHASCQQNFGANLIGFCGAGKSDDDKLEALLCLFGVPTMINEASKGLAAQTSIAAVKALAEKPGFAAQNYTVFATQTRPLFTALLYRESQAAPVLAAVCQ